MGDVNDTVTTISVNQLNTQNCGDFCADLGYRLFAMRRDTAECACGNNVGTNEVEASSCFRTCSSNKEPCGGPGLESVYTSGMLSWGGV